jgi:membrane protein
MSIEPNSSNASQTDPGVANATAISSRVKALAKDGTRRMFSDVREMFEKRGVATLRYLMTTEVHTYAFSVAANFILAFFPFIVLLMTLTQHVFHSQSMTNVVKLLLIDFLPANQTFIVRNVDAMVNAKQGVRLASLAILLFTSSGVFLPLEVALNKVWGIRKNRSYLGNQLVSIVLAFIVGMLALFSVAATAGIQIPLYAAFSGSRDMVVRALSFVIMKIFAFTASVGLFFFMYWLLPNGKIPARSVLPAAFTVGIVWELSKYVYILLLPWLDFKEVYGPFSISVSLMFWAYLSGMLSLAGAHLSATPETSHTSD